MARYMVVVSNVATQAIEASSADAVVGMTLIQSDTAKVGDTYSGGIFTTPATTPGELQASKDFYFKQVNDTVDSIFASAIGNRDFEYELAESEARAYKLAGYAGTVPGTVSDLATILGSSNQFAADRVISEADTRNAKAREIRRYRIAARSAISFATTLAEVDTAFNIWNNYYKTLAGFVIL